MRKPAFSMLGLALALLVVGANAPAGLAKPLPAPSGYLTGKVTSGRSNPARSVWVMVYDGGKLKGRSLTGDDGRYYIGGLEEKTYTVVVRRQTSGSDLVSQSVGLPQNRVHNISLP